MKKEEIKDIVYLNSLFVDEDAVKNKDNINTFFDDVDQISLLALQSGINTINTLDELVDWIYKVIKEK